MLTDGKILELFDATGGGIVGRLSRFARAIEAEVLQAKVSEQAALIDRCEKALVIAYPNWEQYGDWEINAWARDIIAAITSHRKGIAK